MYRNPDQWHSPCDTRCLGCWSATGNVLLDCQQTITLHCHSLQLAPLMLLYFHAAIFFIAPNSAQYMYTYSNFDLACRLYIINYYTRLCLWPLVLHDVHVPVLVAKQHNLLTLINNKNMDTCDRVSTSITLYMMFMSLYLPLTWV